MQNRKNLGCNLLPHLAAALITLLLLVVGIAHAANETDPGSAAWRDGDYARAVHHWQQAMGQGNHRAAFLLSNAYQQGKGVPRDQKRADELMRSAATGGFAPAQFNLGNSYFHGGGVEQNFPAAVMWWRRAAEQGMVEAQFNLGFAAYRGAGVPRDVAEATRWFRKAAAGGSIPAATMLDEIKAAQQASHADTISAREGGNEPKPAGFQIRPESRQPAAAQAIPQPVIQSGTPEPVAQRITTAPPVAQPTPAPAAQTPAARTLTPSPPTIDTLGDDNYIVEGEDEQESVMEAAGLGAAFASSGEGFDPEPANPPVQVAVAEVAPQPAMAPQTIPQRIYHPNAALQGQPTPPARVAAPAPAPLVVQAMSEARPRPAMQPAQGQPRPQPQLQTTQAPPSVRQAPRQTTQQPARVAAAPIPAPVAAATAPNGQEWYQRQPANHYAIQVFGSDDPEAAREFAYKILRQYPAVGLFAWDNRGETWHGVTIGNFASRAQAKTARADLPLSKWKHPGWPRSFEEIRRTLVSP